MAGVNLELESVERLGRMLRSWEANGPPTNKQFQGEAPGQSFPSLQIIEISGAISGSYYPANVVYYSAGSWTTLGSGKAIELNAKLLVSGRRYFAKYVGLVTVSSVDYPLYACYSPGEVVTDISCSGGSLSVTKTKV